MVYDDAEGDVKVDEEDGVENDDGEEDEDDTEDADVEEEDRSCSRNALEHLTRAIYCRNLQAKGFRHRASKTLSVNFAQASQESFYADI